MTRSNFTPAMRRGAAADLAEMVETVVAPDYSKGEYAPPGFFGECLCGAVVIEDGGRTFDWVFGVYPRTHHSCLATVQKEMNRQRPQLRAEATKRIAQQQKTLVAPVAVTSARSALDI